MIEKHIYDAVVQENIALKREIEELKSKLIVEESMRSSPILPLYDNIYSDTK